MPSSRGDPTRARAERSEEAIMNTTGIIAGALFALAAGALVACGSRSESPDAETGSEAAITGGTEDADAYERRVTCIHHRRERTRAQGRPLARAFHLKIHGCLKGQMF